MVPTPESPGILDIRLTPEKCQTIHLGLQFDMSSKCEVVGMEVSEPDAYIVRVKLVAPMTLSPSGEQDDQKGKHAIEIVESMVKKLDRNGHSVCPVCEDWEGDDVPHADECVFKKWVEKYGQPD